MFFVRITVVFNFFFNDPHRNISYYHFSHFMFCFIYFIIPNKYIKSYDSRNGSNIYINTKHIERRPTRIIFHISLVWYTDTAQFLVLFSIHIICMYICAQIVWYGIFCFFLWPRRYSTPTFIHFSINTNRDFFSIFVPFFWVFAKIWLRMSKISSNQFEEYWNCMCDFYSGLQLKGCQIVLVMFSESFC